MKAGSQGSGQLGVGISSSTHFILRTVHTHVHTGSLCVCARIQAAAPVKRHVHKDS